MKRLFILMLLFTVSCGPDKPQEENDGYVSEDLSEAVTPEKAVSTSRQDHEEHETTDTGLDGNVGIDQTANSSEGNNSREMEGSPGEPVRVIENHHPDEGIDTGDVALGSLAGQVLSGSSRTTVVHKTVLVPSKKTSKNSLTSLNSGRAIPKPLLALKKKSKPSQKSLKSSKKRKKKKKTKKRRRRKRRRRR